MSLRLMMARETQLDGTVEIDEFYLGGLPRKHRGHTAGRKGQKRTAKTPVLAVVERPRDVVIGTVAGGAGPAGVADLSIVEAERVLEKEVNVPAAHLMSDQWRTFVAVGQSFAAHDTVQHSRREYVRGTVHANSVEGFNFRVRRTVAGVFHHISPDHADLYFHEMGFRWSQRVITGQVTRRSRSGRERVRTLWDRISPSLQLAAVLKTAVGRQMRRERQHLHQIVNRCLLFINASLFSEQPTLRPRESRQDDPTAHDGAWHQGAERDRARPRGVRARLYQQQSAWELVERP